MKQMTYSDLEKKRAYHRAYYHRKLGGKGKAYAPRQGLSDEDLLALAKQIFEDRYQCECGCVIPQNRKEHHVNGQWHKRCLSKKRRLEQEQKPVM